MFNVTRGLPNGVRRLFRHSSNRATLVGDMDDEMRTHLELRAAELRAGGLGDREAAAEALRRFGDLAEFRDYAVRRAARRHRRSRIAEWIDEASQDARFALRQFRRTPAITALAIVTLALGIGANTAIFSIVHHVLLNPLPYPDGNRIVLFGLGSQRETDPHFQFIFDLPAAVLRRLEAQSYAVTEVSGVATRQVAVGDGASVDSVTAAAITTSFLPMLRVRPVVGRGFTSEDAHDPSQSVALISYSRWQQQYGGSAAILGKTITVNGRPRVIVGVAPANLDIPILSWSEKPDIWLPLRADSIRSIARVYARLRPGVTSAAAAREAQLFFSQSANSTKDKGLRIYATTAPEQVGSGPKHAIEILFITVVGLLLIACANVANLLFMRGWTRQREFAVRTALGAGRFRLVRQLLTESVALSFAGGALGLVIAWLGLRLGRVSEYISGVQIDRTVLGWTVTLSILTALLFGIGPALWSVAGPTTDALRAGARSIAGSTAARRVRTSLVVGEIALSLSFLIAAALLVRSFVALAQAPIGYDPHALFALRVHFAHDSARGNLAGERQVVRALRAVPGVEAAVIGPEPQTIVRGGQIGIDGPTGPQTADLDVFEMPTVEPAYFRVAGIAIVEGRAFGSLDAGETSSEAIVNQSLARRLWPNRDPLGASIYLGTLEKRFTVVGVAHDLHLAGTSGDMFNLQIYVPANAAPGYADTFLVRANGALPQLGPLFERAVRSAGVSASVLNMDDVESTVDRRVLARPRRALALFGLFAIIALALSTAGLYGVIAYAVAQRTREIGVRVALGADPLAITRLILADIGAVVATGTVCGLLVAYAATRALTAFLYDIAPTDPFAFGGATVLLLFVGLIASLLPARRALRINPSDALRAE